MNLTQRERVLKAARSFRGITQVDFLLPNVVDGGEPITRLAARINELDSEGYGFECLGRRDRCKIWRLVSEPDSGGGSSRAPAEACRGGIKQPLPAPSTKPASTLEAAREVAAVVGYRETEERLFETGKPERPHWMEDAA